MKVDGATVLEYGVLRWTRRSKSAEIKGAPPQSRLTPEVVMRREQGDNNFMRGRSIGQRRVIDVGLLESYRQQSEQRQGKIYTDLTENLTSSLKCWHPRQKVYHSFPESPHSCEWVSDRVLEESAFENTFTIFSFCTSTSPPLLSLISTLFIAYLSRWSFYTITRLLASMHSSPLFYILRLCYLEVVCSTKTSLLLSYDTILLSSNWLEHYLKKSTVVDLYCTSFYFIICILSGRRYCFHQSSLRTNSLAALLVSSHDTTTTVAKYL